MNGFRLLAALLLTFAFAENLQALDFGWWNVPGNCGQFVGHGFGAGHHAPIVRAPARYTPRVPRVAIDRSPAMCRVGYADAHHYGYHSHRACSGTGCATSPAPIHYHSTPHVMPTPARTGQPFSAPEAVQPGTQQRGSNGEVLPTPEMPKPDATATTGSVPGWKTW